MGINFREAIQRNYFRVTLNWIIMRSFPSWLIRQ